MEKKILTASDVEQHIYDLIQFSHYTAITGMEEYVAKYFATVKSEICLLNKTDLVYIHDTLEELSYYNENTDDYLVCSALLYYASSLLKEDRNYTL